MNCNFSGYNAGNLLSVITDENQWQKVIKNSEICTSKGYVDVLLPWCLGMHEAKLLCNKFKGQMTIITSSELQEKLFLSIQGIYKAVTCFEDGMVWTGFSDEQDEGHFVDSNEKTPWSTMMDFIPFDLSQPNGEKEENCLVAFNNTSYENSWYDSYCYSRNIPSFCRIDKNPRILIRGENSKNNPHTLHQK